MYSKEIEPERQLRHRPIFAFFAFFCLLWGSCGRPDAEIPALPELRLDSFQAPA
jgi:hypothetical protein